MKQYTVGIDLGTSNTVVAYVEAGADDIRVFDVDQLVSPGEVGARRACRRRPAIAVERRRAD
jgi:molecular chaperone DnaK (HSP70)